MKTYQEIIKPTLVLMIIASIIAALLAVTYNVTGVAELANAAYSAEELTQYGLQLPYPMKERQAAFWHLKAI